MNDPRIVDQRQTDLWALAPRPRENAGNRAPLVREVARIWLDKVDSPDEEIDLLLDLASPGPEWLAIRTLPDGRFAGVMPALDGYGVLGVSPYALPDAQWFAATWEYERAIDAIAALQAWDPVRFPEPGGFSRRCGGPPIQQALRMPGGRCGP